MSRWPSLEELKLEYIGKVINWYTIVDVLLLDRPTFVCRCKCGNIRNIPKKRLLGKQPPMSCGCYVHSDIHSTSVSEHQLGKFKLDLNALREEYIGKVFNWLTIIDVFRNDSNKIMFRCRCKCGTVKDLPKKCFHNKPPMSCGCYKFSEENSARVSEWYKNDTARSENVSEKVSLWCKSNPNKVKERGKKYSEWYSSNPDKTAEMVRKYSSWRNAHSDEMSVAYKDAATKKRAQCVASIDLSSLIHEEDMPIVLSGCISSTKVRTKCPLCNMYDTHRLYTFINYTKQCLYKEPLCKHCFNTFTSSHQEHDIESYIKSIYSGECLRNDRLVLDGKELDLYYPEKKVAIEFNGTYWHDNDHKHTKYHFDKFNACLVNGVRLISIFEHAWKSNTNEVLNVINNAFSANKHRVYARCCNVEITTNSSIKDPANFVYYINDNCSDNSITYRLIYKDCVVSLMSFSIDSNNEYRLSQYLVRNNFVIVGGAQRLLSLFIHSDYHPHKIYCSSDNNYFDGSLLTRIGFTKVSNFNESIVVCNKHGIVQNYTSLNENDKNLHIIHTCGYSTWQLDCNLRIRL